MLLFSMIHPLPQLVPIRPICSVVGGDQGAAACSSVAPARVSQAAVASGVVSLAPYRAVVWLHDVEGYTHKEIARVFGKTESYSKSQLARGYEKLVLDEEVEAEPREDKETRRVRERVVDDTGGKDDGLAKAADVRPACLS